MKIGAQKKASSGAAKQKKKGFCMCQSVAFDGIECMQLGSVRESHHHIAVKWPQLVPWSVSKAGKIVIVP